LVQDYCSSRDPISMALSVKRLRKENVSLQKEPVPLAIARPLESNILEWRFLIQGKDEYEGGFFQGRLIFPPQYPMKPPGIMFCTPSGITNACMYLIY
jgi:ubiquitin-conjugating enzyme E2 J2